jgi:3D (Asp-Asp-Asp) domain-containing protein
MKRLILVLLITAVILPSNVTPPNPFKIETMVKEEVVKEIKKFVVTMTTYTIDPLQTDDTPLETASGFELDEDNPKKHRVIAVSRDIKKKFKFGEKVRVSNAGKYNGVYYVRDLMNPRWKNKIDILINPDDNHTKLNGVILSKLN